MTILGVKVNTLRGHYDHIWGENDHMGGRSYADGARNGEHESRKLLNNLRYRVGSKENGSTFLFPFSTNDAKRIYKKMYICAKINAHAYSYIRAQMRA